MRTDAVTDLDKARTLADYADEVIERMATALETLRPGSLHHYQSEWLALVREYRKARAEYDRRRPRP